jgi:hypothetical protein
MSVSLAPCTKFFGGDGPHDDDKKKTWILYGLVLSIRSKRRMITQNIVLSLSLSLSLSFFLSGMLQYGRMILSSAMGWMDRERQQLSLGSNRRFADLFFGFPGDIQGGTDYYCTRLTGNKKFRKRLTSTKYIKSILATVFSVKYWKTAHMQ